LWIDQVNIDVDIFHDGLFSWIVYSRFWYKILGK